MSGRGGRWFHFRKNFLKIFKNEGLGPKFWDTQYKFFFALIKKIFLQTLIEIIFRITHLFITVLGPPYERNEFFPYEVLGIKIG